MARDTAHTDALAAPVELDLPAVTVGSKLTRSTTQLMCEHQQAVKKKAAAEAAYRDADKSLITQCSYLTSGLPRGYRRFHAPPRPRARGCIDRDSERSMGRFLCRTIYVTLIA